MKKFYHIYLYYFYDYGSAEGGSAVWIAVANWGWTASILSLPWAFTNHSSVEWWLYRWAVMLHPVEVGIFIVVVMEVWLNIISSHKSMQDFSRGGFSSVSSSVDGCLFSRMNNHLYLCTKFLIICSLFQKQCNFFLKSDMQRIKSNQSGNNINSDIVTSIIQTLEKILILIWSLLK